MSRTPPRLKAAFSGKPLSKINLKSAYAELRREQPAEPTISALMLGRAFDASARNDADFFVDESSPILALADALCEVLRRSPGEYADVLKFLEKHDAVEISVALDRMRKILSPDTSSPEAVVRGVSLSSELLGSVRPDVGLDDKTACHVLTHAALEAYYLRGASAAAKKELDLSLELIRQATGSRVEFIQPEQKLEIGLEVWEAWQGVQALDPILGLRSFAHEMEKRGEHVAAGLALGADVLLRATSRKVDREVLAESLSALEQYAADRGRKHAQSVSAIELGAFAPDRPPPLTPDFEYDGEDTLPDFRPHLPLLVELRAVMTATAAERDELTRAARRKPRAAAAIIEDMLSIIERYDILMNGDDHSLVFELAPMLQRSMRVLYGELEVFHPALEAAIYAADPTNPTGDLMGVAGSHREAAHETSERDLHALRVLVSKTADLAKRSRQLGEAFVAGGIEVGFKTDFGAQTEKIDARAMPPDPAALRGRIEALLIVLRARGIALDEAQRTRVMQCTDPRTIDLWLERAANTRAASEVFG